MRTPAETREAEMRRLERGVGRLPDTLYARVVGLTFVDGYPENIHRLRDVINEAQPKRCLGFECPPECIDCHLDRTDPLPTEPMSALLRRNPDNPHDSNAIEIHIPSLGDDGMVGHLGRTIAARIAPEIDAGTQWAAAVEAALINPEHFDRPGLSIQLARIPEEEPA